MPCWQNVSFFISIRQKSQKKGVIAGLPKRGQLSGKDSYGAPWKDKLRGFDKLKIHPFGFKSQKNIFSFTIFSWNTIFSYDIVSYRAAYIRELFLAKFFEWNNILCMYTYSYFVVFRKSESLLCIVFAEYYFPFCWSFPLIFSNICRGKKL